MPATQGQRSKDRDAAIRGRQMEGFKDCSLIVYVKLIMELLTNIFARDEIP
jgi:hypothetical protein